MNPDAFMPFYGNQFFTATKGLNAEICWAYLKACWYYWSHNHCKGLQDDSEFLRGICEIDSTRWNAYYPIIFDNQEFFCLGEDGRWHQKRTFELRQEAVTNYNKACARTRAATEARKRK